jgi:adenylate cyclase
LRNESGIARELADDVIALAEQANAPATLAAAHSALAMALFSEGHADEAAREHFERAIELFGAGPFRNFGEAYYAQVAEGMLGTVLLSLGYPSTALAKQRESLAAARRRSDPFLIFSALFSGAMNHLILRDSRTAAELAEEIVSIANEHGMNRQDFLFFRGWARSATELAREGITEMRRAISYSKLAKGPTAAMLATLAEACGKNGLPEEGLEAVVQGMTLDETRYRAELQRVKGELLLMRDPSDEAEALRCFRTAIDIARGRKARLFELRATTSLARLLQRQGQRDEARALLSEIYNWFTEGFEFADLKDAKALLDELVG